MISVHGLLQPLLCLHHAWEVICQCSHPALFPNLTASAHTSLAPPADARTYRNLLQQSTGVDAGFPFCRCLEYSPSASPYYLTGPAVTPLSGGKQSYASSHTAQASHAVCTYVLIHTWLQ
jgi:hypothetical protein